MIIESKNEIESFTVDYYSRKWEKYNLEDLKNRIEIAKPILEPIILLIDTFQDCKILDIGTGPGTIPFAIIEMLKPKYKMQIVGIDPSSSVIQFANTMAKKLKKNDILHFEEGGFEKIPFPNNKFDVVISNASFNISTNKEDALNEMSRVVKYGGSVIIADCFRKSQKKHKPRKECNNRLWAVCISGAVQKGWLIEYSKSYGLHLKRSKDLTNVVTNLIQAGKWDWKEFIDFDLEYHIIHFIKKSGKDI